MPPTRGQDVLAPDTISEDAAFQAALHSMPPTRGQDGLALDPIRRRQ